MSTADEEISVREATTRLGITLDAVYRLIWGGRIKARKVGKKWFVSAASVDQRLKERAVREGKYVNHEAQ